MFFGQFFAFVDSTRELGVFRMRALRAPLLFVIAMMMMMMVMMMVVLLLLVLLLLIRLRERASFRLTVVSHQKIEGSSGYCRRWLIRRGGSWQGCRCDR